jgi:hypothetical protein
MTGLPSSRSIHRPRPHDRIIASGEAVAPRARHGAAMMAGEDRGLAGRAGDARGRREAPMKQSTKRRAWRLALQALDRALGRKAMPAGAR